MHSKSLVLKKDQLKDREEQEKNEHCQFHGRCAIRFNAGNA